MDHQMGTPDGDPQDGHPQDGTSRWDLQDGHPRWGPPDGPSDGDPHEVMVLMVSWDGGDMLCYILSASLHTVRGSVCTTYYTLSILRRHSTMYYVPLRKREYVLTYSLSVLYTIMVSTPPTDGSR